MIYKASTKLSNRMHFLSFRIMFYFPTFVYYFVSLKNYFQLKRKNIRTLFEKFLVKTNKTSNKTREGWSR